VLAARHRTAGSRPAPTTSSPAAPPAAVDPWAAFVERRADGDR
jgi:hypothetical protein